MDNSQDLRPDETEGDVDSAIGDDQSTLTQSLRSSLLESVQENGRGYHRYKSTAGNYYVFPEDEREQDRLDLQHLMFCQTFDGKLYSAPLVKKEIRNVLDIATGTGIWAIDFADEFPEAEVVGTDLSPIQPQYVPANCKFEIDDFNSEWTFNQTFDFIHCRGLCGSSKPEEIQNLIKKCYQALNPGGFLEMPDVHMPFGDIDGTMRDSKLEQWSNRQIDACTRIGIDISAAAQYKDWMVAAGFHNVKEIQYKWPIGTWPKDARQKQLGKMTMMNMSSGLEGMLPPTLAEDRQANGVQGFTLRLWTGVLGMEHDAVLVDLVDVRKDIASSKVHAYWPMYSAYGQKPKTTSS